MSDSSGAARLRRLAVAALVFVTGFVAPDGPPPNGRQAGERYAVVVHPGTPVQEVTLAQLRRLFRGEQQFWPKGARVVLFVQAQGTPERALILRRVYEMDEGAFKRYWIGKTFRDEVASGPKIVSTSALARRLTSSIPGAVAVIPLGAVDESVRVLRVDGRLPDDAGYPLSAEPAP